MDKRTGIHAWPFGVPGGIDDNRHKGIDEWVEVDVKIYDDMLDVLPPIIMRYGAFMVGEPADHNERGFIYTAFVEIDGRFFGKDDNLVDFDPAKYREEIRKQFNL